MPILSRSALRCLALALLAFLATSCASSRRHRASTESAYGGASLGGPDEAAALALMKKGQEAEAKGHIHSAISQYEKIGKRYGTSVYAPEAYYRVANLRLQRKQYYKAFEALQNIIARYPSEKRFDELIGKEYQIAGLLLDGARNHIWGIIPGFRSRERGIGYFETVVANAPYSDYAPLALMSAARGYERLNDTEEAIDALDRMVNGYQQSVLVPYAYLELAKTHGSLVEGAYYDQGETHESITYYEDFMILFPGDPNIGVAAKGLDTMKRILADSKMRIGDFYFFRRDNYTAARVFYNEAITSYPDSEIARRAKQRLAQVEAKANGTLVPEKKKHFLFF